MSGFALVAAERGRSAMASGRSVKGMRWASLGRNVLVLIGLATTYGGCLLSGYALSSYAAAGALLGAAVALAAVALMATGVGLMSWAAKIQPRERNARPDR